MPPFVVPTQPSGSPFPSPYVISGVFRKWQLDPKQKSPIDDMFPDEALPTPSIVYDVIQPAFGVLDAGDMDADPQESAHRGRSRLVIPPTYYTMLKSLKPSDVCNVTAAGSIDRLAAEQLAMDNMEDIGIAMTITQRMHKIGALLGGYTPTNRLGTIGAGANPYSYSYPVTYAPQPSVPWTNTANATPITDVQNAAFGLDGKGLNPRVYYNRYQSNLLSQNLQIQTLIRNTIYSTDLDPGDGSISQTALGRILEDFTGVQWILLNDGYNVPANDGTGNYTYQRFLPNNKVIVCVDPPYGQTMGTYALCPTIHAEGASFLNPRGGKFMVTIDDSDDKINPRYSQLGGMNGAIKFVFCECSSPMLVVF